jgi:hypothetical protein
VATTDHWTAVVRTQAGTTINRRKRQASPSAKLAGATADADGVRQLRAELAGPATGIA